MRKITDMGNVGGNHIYHIEGRPSMAELIADGTVVAFPDDTEPNGIAVKFASKCTQLELQAAYTVDEISRFNQAAGLG